MSVEIYNNFQPRIVEHLDKRLKTVLAASLLPDPTVADNFIYEGALVYVAGTTDKYYKCVMNNAGTNLEWKPLLKEELMVGTINITPGTTVLDLGHVTPAVENCKEVVVNIVGGTSATIQIITNFPIDDRVLTLTITAGQQITFKHNNYDVATTGQIVMEVGFDMVLRGRLVGNESLSLKSHGGVLCQWGATQFMRSSEWAQSLLSVSVVDNLTTTSTVKALSANQGVILNNKIESKQKQLIPGSKVQIIPGLSTDTINVIPNYWSALNLNTSPSSSIQTRTYLANQNAPISQDYLYADLRELPLQAGGNRGFWICPPTIDPSVPANWIMLDKPFSSSKHTQYNYALDEDPAASLVLNAYYPRVNITNYIGDNLDLAFNVDGPSNKKTSTALNKAGLYKVVFDILLEVTGTPSNKNFIGSLYITNGVQSHSLPNYGGVIKKQLTGVEPNSNESIRYVHFHTSFTLDVTTVGVANGFTFGLREDNQDWSNTKVSPLSTVQITKIR